jgi:hypothetical protein
MPEAANANEPAYVLVGVEGGVASCSISGNCNVMVVVVDWDDLEQGTLGDYCRAYKEVWGLPDDLKAIALPSLIHGMRKRHPITATFQPQQWQDDYAVPCGDPTRFDVTEALLTRGPDYIDNLRDDDYPTDDLAEGLPERERHDGPFLVRVKDAALAFLYADENEAEDARAQPD